MLFRSPVLTFCASKSIAVFGVAPETAIDFDAQNVSTGHAFLWWASGMGLFFLLWEGVKHYDPPHLARCVWIPGSGDRVGSSTES